MKDYLKYPMEDPKAPMKLGLGTVLLFPGIILVVPFFLVLGFLHRVLLVAVKGKSAELPSYEQPLKLLIQGLTTFSVWLAYLVPAAILGAVALIPSMAGGGGGFFAPQNILSTFLRFGSLVLWLGGFLFLPMALARFAALSKLASAFQFSEILADIRKSPNDYLFLSGSFAVGMLVLGFLSNFISGLPFYIGALLGMAAYFYFGVSMMRWTGVHYREKVTPSATEDESPKALPEGE